MNELDWDVINTLVPKCDICKLLVDLRQHWESAQADEQMSYDGITYRRMCENGNWWPPAFPRRTLYTIFVDFDSVTAKRFQTYEISSDPLSDRSKRQMKHWIGSCMSNHAQCPSKLKDLPKRVIDVRGTTLKLVDPSPSGPNAYVALSHCWGSCRDFLTTRENVEERKAGFNVGQLPSTFRDAVLATRALDIPYLWVDSICILQGDKEDWETEGSKLAETYSDATITICAANATDDAEGFLRQRQRPPTATIEIRWPSLGENVRKDRLTRFYVHREHDSRDRKDFLSERAWCMQERYLSPRLISFAQDAIEWECFEAEIWETSRPGSTSGLSIFSGRNDDQRLYSKWAEMVAHYSRRALTYSTDTLPALSAVASRAARATGDEYLAGLWRKDLLRWLLWRGIRYGGGFNRAENPTRSEVYHAPSWSWASYAGSVSFQAPPSEEKCQMFNTIANIEAHVVVPGKNKFGSVSTATLNIQTPLLSCKASSEPNYEQEKDWQGYIPGIFTCEDLGDFDGDIKVILDYPGEKYATSIFAIPIVHHSGAIYSKYHVAAGTLQEGASDAEVQNLAIVYGLLIRMVSGAEKVACERVGLFQIGWVPMDRFLALLGSKPISKVTIV